MQHKSNNIVSVVFPRQVADIDELIRFAKFVTGGTATRLWLGQSLDIESHAALAYLAGHGVSIPVGIATALAPLRHPFDAAVQARSLAALSGAPVSIAYGASSPAFVESLYGQPWEGPARHVEEYISIVRDLVVDGRSDYHGRFYSAVSELAQRTLPTIEIGAGVLRPAMARAVGRVGDLAVTWLAPASFLSSQLVPQLAMSGRLPRVVAMLPVAIRRPGVDPAAIAREAFLPHLATAHYTDMLRTAGVKVDPTDPEEGVRTLVREGIFAYGTPAQIRRKIDELFSAGADEVALHSGGVAGAFGWDAARSDLAAILAV